VEEGSSHSHVFVCVFKLVWFFSLCYSWTSDSKLFSLWAKTCTVALQEVYKLLASAWGCTVSFSLLFWLFLFLRPQSLAATGSPGLLAWRWPLWDFAASGHLSPS
jgi:hypothetical protein